MHGYQMKHRRTGHVCGRNTTSVVEQFIKKAGQLKSTFWSSFTLDFRTRHPTRLVNGLQMIGDVTNMKTIQPRLLSKVARERREYLASVPGKRLRIVLWVLKCRPVSQRRRDVTWATNPLCCFSPSIRCSPLASLLSVQRNTSPSKGTSCNHASLPAPSHPPRPRLLLFTFTHTCTQLTATASLCTRASFMCTFFLFVLFKLKPL